MATQMEPKKGTKILISFSVGDYREVEERVVERSNKTYVFCTGSPGTFMRAEEGARWVRSDDVENAANFRARHVAERETRLAVLQAKLKAAETKRAEDAQRHKHEREQQLIADIRTALAAVNAADVPADLRETAFQFALLSAQPVYAGVIPGMRSWAR